MPNRGGFSWKRLTGISAAKARISRKTGIPLSRSGRQAKLGRLVSGGGCLVVVAFVGVLLAACGNSCIALNKTCKVGPGCACD
jgi:hypothetical protein